jgi:hypothetical protein
MRCADEIGQPSRAPSSSASTPVGRGSAQPGHLKGQLHVHSNHPARGGYVRATLADARGHRAWLQPTRVE